MYKRLFDVLKNLNDFVQKTESSTSAVDPLNTMDKPLGKQNKPGTRAGDQHQRRSVAFAKFV